MKIFARTARFIEVIQDSARKYKSQPEYSTSSIDKFNQAIIDGLYGSYTNKIVNKVYKKFPLVELSADILAGLLVEQNEEIQNLLSGIRTNTQISQVARIIVHF